MGRRYRSSRDSRLVISAVAAGIDDDVAAEEQLDRQLVVVAMATEAGVTACEEIQGCFNQCAAMNAANDGGTAGLLACKTSCEAMTDAGVADYDAFFTCAAANATGLCALCWSPWKSPCVPRNASYSAMRPI